MESWKLSCINKIKLDLYIFLRLFKMDHSEQYTINLHLIVDSLCRAKTDSHKKEQIAYELRHRIKGNKKLNWTEKGKLNCIID